MRYERVQIARDTNTVVSRLVPEWEIPVIEFIFDDGNVTRTGEFSFDDKEYPTAEVEYDRLMRAYGSDIKSNVPHVGSVYGQSRAGLRAIRKVIEDAKLEDAEIRAEAEQTPAPAPAPRAAKGRKSAPVVDSLLS